MSYDGVFKEVLEECSSNELRSVKPSYEELEAENKVLKAKLEELNKELARITDEIFGILFPASWGGTKWIKTRAKIRKYKYLKMKN